jgi:hypothetical protein
VRCCTALLSERLEELISSTVQMNWTEVEEAADEGAGRSQSREEPEQGGARAGRSQSREGNAPQMDTVTNSMGKAAVLGGAVEAMAGCEQLESQDAFDGHDETVEMHQQTGRVALEYHHRNIEAEFRARIEICLNRGLVVGMSSCFIGMADEQ